MIVKVWGHILVIFGSILAPKMVPNSNFFYVKKQHDFEYHFFMIFGVLEVVFGVDFRTLGYSNMSIWFRRNTDFHKSGLPKSRLKNESPQSSEKMRLWLNFGFTFLSFLVPKTLPEIKSKKEWGKSWKKWSPGALREFGSPPRNGFWDPGSLLGG